jgi:hypothetical protein
MSADNYIYIDRKTNEVWNCMASETVDTHESKSLEGQKLNLIGKGKDLADAMDIAEKHDDWTIEYGIHTKLWCK